MIVGGIMKYHQATINLIKQLEIGIICIPYCEGIIDGSDEQKEHTKEYLQTLRDRNIITKNRYLDACNDLGIE
jgi:hypothetical protein